MTEGGDHRLKKSWRCDRSMDLSVSKMLAAREHPHGLSQCFTRDWMAQCALLWPVSSPGSFGYLSEWQLVASMDGLGVEATVAVLKTELCHISAWFIGTHQHLGGRGRTIAVNLSLPWASE